MQTLTEREIRILGVLIEKEKTTPEQYPLSLNALTNGCNQKSNREPVLQLTETEVQAAVDLLVNRRLVSLQQGFGSRVVKYQHRFCNTEFSEWTFSDQELGLLCVLFLRGAQTPGELRGRSQRLCEFSDVQEAEAVLQNLIQREGGPFVEKLSRESGKQESRYRHCFLDYGDEVESVDSPAVSQDVKDDRVSQLEQRVDALEALVDKLIARLEDAESC